MCLDQGAFLLINGDEEIALDDIASLLPLAAGIKLVDVFGKSRQIDGMIEEIDLLNKRITLK